MNKIIDTLNDLNSVSRASKVLFVITRYFNYKNPDDLDILVKKEDYSKFILSLKTLGYETSSHDNALGGRMKGSQINLVKKSRIKIDLHKDFTWRASKYFDLDIIWNNLNQVKIGSNKYYVPSEVNNAFILLVNVLFEKTYLNKSDFTYLKSNFHNIVLSDLLIKQSQKYNWPLSYGLFCNWFKNQKKQNRVIFVPVFIILLSYIEKLFRGLDFNIISFMYYVYFRTRYLIKGTLPYE